MRTEVGVRRHQGAPQGCTEEEIEEIEEVILQESNPPQEEIYVAVGKDVCESVSAVKWALQNLSNREETLIILLHIQLPLRSIPTPMGKLPVNQVSEDVVAAHLREKKEELNSRMQKYLDICTKAQVKAEILFVEKDDVAKGIVEVVSEKGVEKLIMGTTSAGGAISRRMRMRTRGKADYVRRHAIESCDVWIVCKEKLVLHKESSPVDDVAQKCKRFRTPSSDLLRERSEPCTVEPSSEICHRSASAPPNFGGDLQICKRDSTSTWSEEVNDSKRTFTIDKDSSRSESVDLHFDEVYAYDTVQPQPQGGNQDALADVETLKEQLRQALKVAENARVESQKETAKRKKAEAAAVKASYRIKELESIYKETMKEKEEATSSLRLAKEKCQEFSRRQTEVEETLQSMADKINQISCERKEAIFKLQAERQKLAATVEQNHRILQEKEAQIKFLQDCLNSRPPLQTLPSSSSSSQNLDFSEYTFDEIKEATSNFSEHFKIGQGGYGIVYKGETRQTTIAVKILRENSLQGRREFEREIDILREARHPHLVRVVGACFEQGCVIYEYMSNGSLAEYLSSSEARRPLPWQARIRIAAEICSALQYLHSFKPDPIVHRDLKPENILLDENYVSKISDFGLARPLPLDSQSESEPKGTFCYMDPEYLTSGKYSTKSDVYSLGIIILQLLTGKPALRLIQEWTDRFREKRPELQPTVMKMLNELRSFAVPASNASRSVERGQKGVQKADEIHVPGFFLCPIFKEIMRDPYVATDGFTYEKEAIQGWFDRGKDTSPMTNKKLGEKNLIPNISLRSTIRQWEERGHLY
ncbi:U-box domain-containing protein 33 isoform X2 [Cryptomeria japonica]|uniref:U-box domain-containing protein 33 isoform X2 n=1 Tax=Cryptomeria japonica TaxID=3369 RepID=UPI0027DAA30E|nr:U-box domain-containing protein 33 isoform X2 [Cryptomeria japonica]